MKDATRMDEVQLIIDEAKRLVSSLHAIDIHHGDIHEENIVYDRTTSDVKIIDFGLSKKISLIEDYELENCIECCSEGHEYAGEPTNDIPYLLRCELGILDHLRNFGPIIE